MNNEIVLNEEELDGITTSLSSSFKSVSNTRDGINPSFSGAVNAGLLGNSIGTISNQMTSISDSINNTQGLIKEYKEQLLTYDNNMATKIDNIEIPKDFLANNSSKVNTYTQSLLSKIDGKSVNLGGSANDTYDTFESSISDKALTDISNGSIDKNEYDDSSSIDVKDAITDINNTSTTELSSYDDNSSILEDFELIDMIPRDIMDDVYYDDSTSIDKEEISDINNDNVFAEFNNDDFVDEEIDYYMNKLRERS